MSTTQTHLIFRQIHNPVQLVPERYLRNKGPYVFFHDVDSLLKSYFKYIQIPIHATVFWVVVGD